MTSIYEGTYALGFQNVAVGSINRGFLQGYDYTRGDFSGFVTNPTHFGTAFVLLLYTQMRKSEIKTSTGYGSVNSKRAHSPWAFVILFWKSWKCSMVGPVWPLSSVLFSYDRLVQLTDKQPEKTADIWRRYHWFPRQMTSEKRAQIFHTDDASLPRSG